MSPTRRSPISLLADAFSFLRVVGVRPENPKEFMLYVKALGRLGDAKGLWQAVTEAVVARHADSILITTAVTQALSIPDVGLARRLLALGDTELKAQPSLASEQTRIRLAVAEQPNLGDPHAAVAAVLNAVGSAVERAGPQYGSQLVQEAVRSLVKAGGVATARQLLSVLPSPGTSGRVEVSGAELTARCDTRWFVLVCLSDFRLAKRPRPSAQHVM